MSFKEIDLMSVDENAVHLFDKSWALVTAGNREKSNTMTISWGGLGELWNEQVVTVYIRDSRYTKEFLDSEDIFSVCVFDEDYRDKLLYCGTVSGRDEDKISKAGLKLAFDENGTPYFEDARLVIIAKKVYVQEMEREKILDDKYLKEFYSEDGIHTIYIGKAEKVLVRE